MFLLRVLLITILLLLPTWAFSDPLGANSQNFSDEYLRDRHAGYSTGIALDNDTFLVAWAESVSVERNEFGSIWVQRFTKQSGWEAPVRLIGGSKVRWAWKPDFVRNPVSGVIHLRYNGARNDDLQCKSAACYRMYSHKYLPRNGRSLAESFSTFSVIENESYVYNEHDKIAFAGKEGLHAAINYEPIGKGKIKYSLVAKAFPGNRNDPFSQIIVSREDLSQPNVVPLGENRYLILYRQKVPLRGARNIKEGNFILQVRAQEVGLEGRKIRSLGKPKILVEDFKPEASYNNLVQILGATGSQSNRAILVYQIEEETEGFDSLFPRTYAMEYQNGRWKNPYALDQFEGKTLHVQAPQIESQNGEAYITFETECHSKTTNRCVFGQPLLRKSSLHRLYQSDEKTSYGLLKMSVSPNGKRVALLLGRMKSNSENYSLFASVLNENFKASPEQEVKIMGIGSSDDEYELVDMNTVSVKQKVEIQVSNNGSTLSVLDTEREHPKEEEASLGVVISHTAGITCQGDNCLRSAEDDTLDPLKDDALASGDASIFHNEQNPYDVDGDGELAPRDALLVINLLRKNVSSLEDLRDYFRDKPAEAFFYPDVNGDGILTPLDALLVINAVN